MKNRFVILIAGLCLAMAGGCGGGSGPAPESGSAGEPVASSAPVSTNKADYPVFPDADAGADPSVSAEQGGKGFTGKGWETNTDFDLIGDPHALKGGVLRDYLPDFPGTLRLAGPESNSQFNVEIGGLAYESLLGVDPTTLKYIPAIATHWQISPDKLTYRFRMNPKARFSDGTPVTAADVVASYDFRMDPTIQDPMAQLVFGKVNRPVPESRYLIRVQAKEVNWRAFLYFSGMPILPAHVLKDVNGEAYLKNYNFKILPGSGPYTIQESDVHKGLSISVRRRKDYWAEKARANIGVNNFDELNFTVVRDENLVFEKLKKGELDISQINIARQWVEQTDFDNVQRGLIQKRKIYNSPPTVFEGIAINTRQAPLDDIRVRKALTLLLDRRTLLDKIMHNEYELEYSYLAGTPYENPSDPKNEYDPDKAVQLLTQAGYTTRDGQGRLVKNGAPLQVELLYDTKTFEPHLTIYQEDLRKVGITLNLRLVTPETTFQLVSQRRFQMAVFAWGGTLFPDFEGNFQSTLADVENTNNITGFKDKHFDDLLKQYDRTFDVDARSPILREMDGILANSYQYVLFWDAPFTRVLYWNKFGTPSGYLTRTGDYYTAHILWWVDPGKNAALQNALRNSSVKLEVGPTDNRYWLDYGKTQQTSQR